MSFEVNKTETIAGILTGSCAEALVNAINADGAITGTNTCEGVRVDIPDQFFITFSGTGPLSGTENTALDSLLGSFTCPIESDNQNTLVNIEKNQQPVQSNVDTINFEGAVHSVYDTSDAEQSGVEVTVTIGGGSVRNESGVTIPALTPVYVTGYDDSTKETLVAEADASVQAEMPSAGILLEALLNGESGTTIEFGPITNINTLSYSVNDSLYVAVGGGLTTTKPTGVGNLVQKVGTVVSSHATEGVIFVAGANRVNDLPNLEDGYAWVGNGSDVPTPTLVSSFAGDPDQNVWVSIIGNTGITSPDVVADSLSIIGSGGGIETAVLGDSVVFFLIDDIAAVEALAGTGFAVRTAINTWAQRTITAGTGISVSNGDGVSGNPTITNTAPNVDQNLWETINGDTGSTTANSITDTLTIAGGTGITTAVSGDTITITSSATSGGISKRMNTWTALSGNLFYNDFAHNLGTDEITTYIYDFATNQELRPEYTEIIDANTLRVVVEGNTCDIVTNVVSGFGPAGPTGPAGPAGANNVNIQDEGGSLANTPHGTLNFVGSAVTAVDSGGGVATITIGGGDVVNDTTPQLGGDLDMNQQNIVYTVPSTDLTTSGRIVVATVDTNAVGFGAALFMATDGNFDTSDANVQAMMPVRALAAETGTGSKKVLLEGFIRNDAWNWIPGGDLYVSGTVGLLTQTAPATSGDQVQKVGFAWSADIVYFSPGDYTIVEDA